jgi:hypothetical protein
MQFIRTFLYLLIAPTLVSCQPSINGTAQQGGDTLTLAQDSLATVINDLRRIPAPDEKGNPVAELGARRTYKMGMVHFSLADVMGLEFTPFDSIGWYEMHEGMTAPENDQVAYYFLNGEGYFLNSTFIRIEWLAKGYPQRNKEDELHAFIKGIFLASPRNGRLIAENAVKTLDGQSVKILEIYVPGAAGDTSRTTSKTNAWAWVDQGNSFVGFSLASTEPAKYKEAILLFRQLISSFRKE